MFKYRKSLKYTDFDTIYEQCSGPGGLQLAEFMAEKMMVKEGSKLLDIGCNRGYPTCFLAKEYKVYAIGIDPWDDRETGKPMVEFVQKNAIDWEVEKSVTALKVGVPQTFFASNTFDYIYSTDVLQMVRVSQGIQGHKECLKEIYRILRPGGVFGNSEPMHLDIDVPEDLEPYISKGEFPWIKCFKTIKETTELIESEGFEILESAYAPDAGDWWDAYAKYDPFCKAGKYNDREILKIDNGRWASFGYVICRKPQ